MASAPQIAEVLLEVLPYIERHREQTFVIKIGGSAMSKSDCLANFATDVVLLQHLGVKPVVVHGGGPEISGYMDRLGIEPRFVDGLRVTDEETLCVAQMVLIGLTGKRIVTALHQAGGRAVGLSGIDGGLLVAEKLRKDSCDVDLGCVGDVTEVNPAVLHQLLADGYLPVVAPLAADREGNHYNVNADHAAGQIAAELGAAKMLNLTDVKGFLRDPQDPASLVSVLTLDEAKAALVSDSASGGMLPKIEGCLRAVEMGVERAHLVDGRVPHALLIELFTDGGCGTMVVR
ncbi:MAG: acetylglutamate kinase [Armatimonadetes bacterium]|nr:acetylglutamate kinase [Armatimonadota bacterium]